LSGGRRPSFHLFDHLLERFPLSRAGEAVRILLTEFIEAELHEGDILGLEWIK